MEKIIFGRIVYVVQKELAVVAGSSGGQVG